MNSSAAASGTVAATGASLSLFPMTYSGKATVTGTLYNCGLATTASDCPAGVSGNIALVQRGSVSFSQKATSAQTAGAAAVVIYNNADGDFYGTLGEDSGWGPVVSSSKAQGEALLALGNAAVTIAVTPSSYSTYAGTSMATPHVAGVAALVRAANPGLSNQQVRDLLTSTATDLGTAGRDNSFGYGLVDAAAAVDAAN
ncbi:MAG: S8 family serine peptidase [Candidatus Schekmanbacteria bacterium]|nr:S8 family serine peptidase [Candidatus Schekmanbacteria bacterium]